MAEHDVEARAILVTLSNGAKLLYNAFVSLSVIPSLTVNELTLDPASASSLITTNGTDTITVVDVPAADLPKVGGDGTLPFLAVGLLLLAGATVYYRATLRPGIAPRRAM